MKYELKNISGIVQQYAVAISKVVNVDVEVVDQNLFRVAGTGIYENKINKDMSSTGFIYRHILATKETQVIFNPGEHELCEQCPEQFNCIESFEIAMPILLEDEIIGVIGLISFDEQSKQRLQGNLHNFLDFLIKIADFISVKMKEYCEAERNASILELLNHVMENIDESVIVLNHQDQIVLVNQSAKQQLRLKEKQTPYDIEIKGTGDTVNDKKEFILKVNGDKTTVIGDFYYLANFKDFSRILIFDELTKMQSEIYNMITTSNQEDIIGRSKAIVELKQKIEKVANSPSTVLITGESGTGKELVASMLWKHSDRKDQPFVAINCAAIPETLLESELFGYVKGAFSGADPRGRIGKFEMANNGIIFLDEIGDMPLYLQTKLLRVIQERSITRIGSNQKIPLNVRILAATNKDLRQMIETNRFREDLYYRLNVLPIEIPPLRERKEDITDLTFFFIRRYSRLFKKKFAGITSDTFNYLYKYNWEGNVRELENAVEYMVNMMEDGILDTHTLPREILQKDEVQISNPVKPLKELEKREIQKALAIYGEDTEGKKQAAKKLGIGIATLYRKISEVQKLSQV